MWTRKGKERFRKEMDGNSDRRITVYCHRLRERYRSRLNPRKRKRVNPRKVNVGVVGRGLWVGGRRIRAPEGGVSGGLAGTE